jgi:hypothetical protein
MKRIAATTLLTAGLLGGLAMPALAGSARPAPVQQQPADSRAAIMRPSNGVAQTPSGSDPQGWRARADWDRSGRVAPNGPAPGPYNYSNWGYSYSPIYVPPQWVWDGRMFVLTPGYWAY